MSEESIGRIVTFTLDPANLPTLTPEQRQRLDAMRDEDIDCSEIPEQTGLGTWSRPGQQGAGAAEVRRVAMREGLLRIDDDVLEFFKKDGDASASRINSVLREYADAHRKSA